MANSVDPDETPRSAASHLGLYSLLRPVCPNTYGKYGNLLLPCNKQAKCDLTDRAPITNVAEDILKYFFLLYIRENKT